MLTALLVNSLVHADFFTEEIASADTEVSMLQDIVLTEVVLKDQKEMKRYTNTNLLITRIQEEAVKRFNDGKILQYRRYDIITSLDSFVYSMNQYFFYQKKYELAKKWVFKDSARSYLEDSKGAYSRLRSALKNSSN
jgi:hypothetical protein